VTTSPDLDALAAALGRGVRRDEPLAPYTAMRVGGPADLLVVAESAHGLVRDVGLARQYGVSWRVLGGGCNVLVADAGLRGLVIINQATSIRFDGETARAETGAKLAVLAGECVRRELGGLAWAAGLPGTVGGAVVGNAGAFGGDIAGTLRSATVLGLNGDVLERPNEWFAFRYRGSRLKGPTEQRGESRHVENADYVVLEAEFALERGDAELLNDRVEHVLTWRKTRHPSGATMGSTFKNPPDSHAGHLIEQAGLKGYRIGGAKISEQHANFFINAGDATAADVLALIEHAQAEVEHQFGIQLELEIELIGW
jgi:UDP-N-acetylmuramate dehydrogenase